MTPEETYMIQGAVALATGYAIAVICDRLARWVAVVLLLAIYPISLLNCFIFDQLRELIK